MPTRRMLVLSGALVAILAATAPLKLGVDATGRIHFAMLQAVAQDGNGGGNGGNSGGGNSGGNGSSDNGQGDNSSGSSGTGNGSGSSNSGNSGNGNSGNSGGDTGGSSTGGSSGTGEGAGTGTGTGTGNSTGTGTGTNASTTGTSTTSTGLGQGADADMGTGLSTFSAPSAETGASPSTDKAIGSNIGAAIRGNGGNSGGDPPASPSFAPSPLSVFPPAPAPPASRSAVPSREPESRNGSLTVRHQNGAVERISRGRYEMRDARSRTIVNRAATPSDVSRLKSLSR